MPTTTKPAHFGSYAAFTRYTLECAIRDRELMIACLQGCHDDESNEQRLEIEAEIGAMKARLKSYRNKP